MDSTIVVLALRNEKNVVMLLLDSLSSNLLHFHTKAKIRTINIPANYRYFDNSFNVAYTITFPHYFAN